MARERLLFQRAINFCLVSLGYLVLRTIGLTLRWQLHDQEILRRFLAEDKAKILVFWHDSQLLLPEAYRRFAKLPDGSLLALHVLISAHRDGRLIARVAQRYGLGVVTGSSTRGGAEALINMARRLKRNECIGITPDGPRGPRHEAKPGAALLAQLLGIPVYSLVCRASSCWKFKSWDKMFLPKPFSRLTITWGEPLTEIAAGEEGLKIACKEIEKRLNEAVARAEEYARS